MKKNTKFLALATILISVIFFKVLPALAFSLVETSTPGYADGNYELSYIREYAIYIARIILGLVGSLSLLAFVYGGVTFLLSAGKQEQIKKGQDIIKAAVIGIIITFSSALIINTFLGGLGINSTGEGGAAKFDETSGAITPVTPSK